MNKQSQNTLIIEYLSKHDGITSLEAQVKLGIMRLASRIADLKKRGYVIIDEWVEVPNRYGGTSRVKCYRLAGEEEWQNEECLQRK